MPPQYRTSGNSRWECGAEEGKAEKRNSEESEASDEMRNTIIVQRK